MWVFSCRGLFSFVVKPVNVFRWFAQSNTASLSSGTNQKLHSVPTQKLLHQTNKNCNRLRLVMAIADTAESAVAEKHRVDILLIKEALVLVGWP